MDLRERIDQLDRFIAAMIETGKMDDAFCQATKQELDWLKELWDYKAQDKECETCIFGCGWPGYAAVCTICQNKACYEKREL